MFNLFKKKEASVKVTDKIWMSEEAKWKGIVNEWKQNPELVIIAWFDATYRHLQTVFAENTTGPVSLFISRQINGPEIADRKIIFAECIDWRRKNHCKRYRRNNKRYHSYTVQTFSERFYFD
jgi:hypothetical protein